MTTINIGSAEQLDAVTSAEQPILVLFSAKSWCIPCQRFEPHWERAQQELPNHIFVKVDMGVSPEDTGEHWATEQFGIRGVPTVMLFNDDGRFDITARAVIPFVREVNSHG